MASFFEEAEDEGGAVVGRQRGQFGVEVRGEPDPERLGIVVRRGMRGSLEHGDGSGREEFAGAAA